MQSLKSFGFFSNSINASLSAFISSLEVALKFLSSKILTNYLGL